MASYNQESMTRTVRSAEIRAKNLFFLAAGMSFLFSVYLYFTGDKQNGIFVGIWVPSILSAGALLLGGRNE